MLHKRLLKLRTDGKMTQKEFSTKLGIARTTYSGYELGTSEPDNETLQRLADYYGVTTDYLLGRELKETSLEENKLREEQIHYAKLIANIEDPIKKQQAIAYLEFLANSPADGTKK